MDRSPNFRMSQPTKPLGSRINSLAGSLHRQHQTRNQIGESIERQKYGKVERLQPRHVEEILGENRVFDYSKIPDALLKNLPRGREDDRICFRPGRLEEMKENECRRFIFFHTPIWITLSDLRSAFPEKFLDVSGLKKGADAMSFEPRDDRFVPWGWFLVGRKILDFPTDMSTLTLQALVYCHLVFRVNTGVNLFSSARLNATDRQGRPTSVLIDGEGRITIPQCTGPIGTGAYARCARLK